MKIFYLLIGLLLPVISFAQIEINCEEAQLNFLKYLTIDGLVYSRDESAHFSCNLEKLNEVGICYFSVNDSLIKNYNIPSHILQDYSGAMMLHFLIFRPKNQMDEIYRFINFIMNSKRDSIQNELNEYMCINNIKKRGLVKADFKAMLQQESDSIIQDDKTFYLLAEDTNQVFNKIISWDTDTNSYNLSNLFLNKIKKGTDNYWIVDNYIRYLFLGETKNMIFVQKYHPLFFANCYFFALNYFYSKDKDVDVLNFLLNLNFKIDVADSINNKIESKKYFYKYALSVSEFQYADACNLYLKYHDNFEKPNIKNLRHLSRFLVRHTILTNVPECNDCVLKLKDFIVSSFNNKEHDDFYSFNSEIKAEYLGLEFVKLFASDPDIIKIVDECLIEVNKKENIDQFVYNNKDKWYQFLNYDYWVGPICEWGTLWTKDFVVKEKLYSQLKNDIFLFAESQGINKTKDVINPMLVEYCTYQLIAQFLYNKDINLKNCRYIISQLDKECFNDKDNRAYNYIAKEMLHVIKSKYFPDILSIKQAIDIIPPIIIINQTPEVVTNSPYEISGFVVDMSNIKYFNLNGSPLIIDSEHRSFKHNITLTEGKNPLKYTAIDAYGNTSTTERNIIYQPIKDEFSVRKNYALLFAVNDYNEYTEWDDLKNPITDAENIAKELVKYGFDTLIIRNPTKSDVQKWIFWYAEKQYTKYDQLLIFYTGHGEYDEKLKKGYLVLSDSKLSDFYKNGYLSYADLTETFDNNSCNHILFISDACYSGTFFKSIASKGKEKDFDFTPTLIKEKLEYKTRLFIGSAGKEKSPDESVFTTALLYALRSTNSKNKVLTYNNIIPYFETLKPQSTNGQFGRNEPGGTFIFERTVDR